MKKISTVILMLFAILVAMPNANAQAQAQAQAQEEQELDVYDYAHKKGLTIGVTGSAVLTGIVTQPSWGQANHNHRIMIKPHYGIDLGYQFSNHFGVSIGLAMLNLGTSLDNKAYYLKELDKDVEEYRTIDMSYFSIPLMLRYVDNRRLFNFVGGIGASYSMIMSADQEWKVKDVATGQEWDYTHQVEIDGQMVEVNEEDVKDRFESADIMINAEAGVRLKATKRLNIDLVTTYSWSLFSSTKEAWNDLPNWQPKDYWSEKPRNMYGGFKVNLTYKLGRYHKEDDR